ncbi:MAG TPA: YciI family protein [Pirellulales bacterium]|jgi:hypothetical protein|nr:YciI family protein [Pirellulales bacterium]
MKYACLIYVEDKKEHLTDADLAAIAETCEAADAWRAGLETAGYHVFSARLQSVRTAKTVSNRNGTVSVTDGPFAETKEFFGGFTIIEARDFKQAIELVSRFPPIPGRIEVRPVMEPNVELTDPDDLMIAAAIQRSRSGD